MNDIIYLDNSATTCMRPSIIDKINESLRNCYGNPSSTHLTGRQAKSRIEKARKTIAKILNAHPGEIIFTSGGTEANNMILKGSTEYLGVQSIITCKLEHHSVIHTVRFLNKQGTDVHFVNTFPNGNINLEHLETLLKRDSSKKLVSLMHINNEIGNIVDIDAVSTLCKKYDTLFHSDTVQSIGHWEWDAKATSVDFMTASAHKFHGPKGIGFAYIRRGTPLGGLILGGGQERGLRAGTESVHNIVGLEAAMVEAYNNIDKERHHVQNLKTYFKEQLDKHFKVSFNGLSSDIHESTYTLLNVRFEEIAEEKILMLQFHLDLEGIACSRGSACQSGAVGGSHVLREILNKDQLNKPSIRFSFSHLNTKEELDRVIQVLKAFMAN